MNKKGDFTWSTIISLLIGVFVVSLIIFILFFPNQLLSKARDSAFSLDIGLHPEEKPPEFIGTSVNKETNSYFANLIKKIKSNTKNDKNDCLIDIGEIPKTKEFRINLYKDIIKLEKTNKQGLSPDYENEEIKDFKPCIITGIESENFFKCNIQNKKNFCNKKRFQETQITLEEEKYSKYLFKFDKNHMCLIPVYDDGADLYFFTITFFSGDCDAPDSENNAAIDAECLHLIDKIKLCKDIT